MAKRHLNVWKNEAKPRTKPIRDSGTAFASETTKGVPVPVASEASKAKASTARKVPRASDT